MSIFKRSKIIRAYNGTVTSANGDRLKYSIEVFEMPVMNNQMTDIHSVMLIEHKKPDMPRFGHLLFAEKLTEEECSKLENDILHNVDKYKDK